MSCTRGKASPDQHTRNRLFAESGGYCQKPDCNQQLFMEVGGERIHVAEIAHICAAGDDGPRADTSLTPEQRGAYENLILLCPTCHTKVDKAPAVFTDPLVRGWKRSHLAKLADVFGTKSYPDRPTARAALAQLLDQNGAVHEQYGPDNDYRFNPESEQAAVWRRKVRTLILPNNRRILALLDENRHLLTAAESHTLERLRQHVDDLEARHIGADPSGGGARFPPEARGLFADGAMTAESDVWTGAWAARALRGHEHVSRVRQLGLKRLEVERRGLPPALVATLSVECVDREALEPILRSTPRPDFVLNLHPSGVLTVEALLLSVEEQLPVGRMGDLRRALYMDVVREYLEPETQFRERGLRQHNRVTDFRRLDFHRYHIERRGLPPLTVVFLNDYELGAEAIRHAREKYGPFDVVVASNPNGEVTDSAEQVAAQLGCEIHKWGAFLSRLHRVHN